MEKWKLSTPVALIIFNRPETTERVFEAIRQAKPRQLFVIADGPRPDRAGEAKKCATARAIIDRLDWDCELLTNYAETNLGCGKRIASGLNWLFESVEEAIILEDDCLPHPTFFRFCDELLKRYRKDERIWVISGNNFQFGRQRSEASYYFSRYPHIWGWATWRRAWQHYDSQIPLWSKVRKTKWLEEVLQDPLAVRYWSTIFQNVFDGFQAWDIAWNFTCWFHNGLTILPRLNLVSNIGFDSENSHTQLIKDTLGNIPAKGLKFPLHHPSIIKRHHKADDFTEKIIFSGGCLSQMLQQQTKTDQIFGERVKMKKHILLYSDDYGLGGVAQHNHSILCGLAGLGYKVTSVQTKTSNPLVSRQQQLGIKHLWLNFDTHKEFERTLTNQEEAQRVFTTAKPDLILFGDSWPLANFAAKQAAKSLGIPYIIIVGFVSPYAVEQSPVSFDELEQLYKNAESVITVSEASLNLMHQVFRLPRERGKVIYYGRPSHYFNPPKPALRKRLRQEIGIPAEAVLCFTAARLSREKGFQYQLEAIKYLKQSPVWPQLYWVWAGAGDLETPIRDAIHQLGIAEKVKLIGHQWNVGEWLDAADIFILSSEFEGMPLAIMEAMAKGLPVIATAVSGIPEELENTGKLLPNPKIDPQGTIKELVNTIEAWSRDRQLRQAVGQAGKNRAEKIFTEERMLQETMETIQQSLLPKKDYVSPNFSIIQPDSCFPNMVVGDPKTCGWPYLRREIPHNWYVDQRQQTIGFLSRDEAHILYNTALKFKGKRALEIGCWLGWSACHLALAGVELDVVDPVLANPDIYGSVSSSLKAAGVFESVNLVAGYSPQKVEELGNQLQRKWSLIFIDGNHEAPGPLNDAIACEQLASEDALILFHDLASPDVAQGLDYFKERGWNTMVYQTMQIMGVAWRGNVEPVKHQPDPTINWQLPAHLQRYYVSGMTAEFQEFLATVRPYTLLSEMRLYSLYTLAKQVCLEDIPGNFVECGTCKGGSAALLASVIKRYSLRPRKLYAFDTFEGMPEPTEADQHNNIPANSTGLGAGTLKAPIAENLSVICQKLGVTEIVIPVKGLFEQTLPETKNAMGNIAFLHADGDWYESTLTIFKNLYGHVVNRGMIQVDDYGFWQGCKQAIHDFETLAKTSFKLQRIDDTGVWFSKESSGSIQEHQLPILNFDTCYAQLREPKKKAAVSYGPGAEEKIVQRLRQLGITVEDWEIDPGEYRRYFQAANYYKDFPNYYPSNLPEKSLEHYIAAKLLQLNPQDIYIDIASQHSPVPQLYSRLFGAKTYQQDLDYPAGVHGYTIGGDAAAMPVPDGFATKMALHCSIEHFEGDADGRFIQEASRILRPGGAVCIVPLYLAEEYAIQTDPVVSVPQGVEFENDAVLYCASGWGNRHGRFYDPEHLLSRIGSQLNGLTLKVYRIKNAPQVHESCYVRFAAVLTKPALNSEGIPSLEAVQVERAEPKQINAFTVNSPTSQKHAIVVFPHNFYPPRTGAHKRCVAIIKGLQASGYAVTVFGFTLYTDDPNSYPWNQDSINRVQKELGIGVEIYQESPSDRQYINQTGGLKGGWYVSSPPPGMREKFRQLFSRLKPGLIVVNYANWTNLITEEAFKSAVKVIDMIDLLTLNAKMQQTVRHFLGTSPYKLEQLKPGFLDEDFYTKLNLNADSIEYEAYDKYDVTIAIAPQEGQLVQQHTQQTQVTYIPFAFEVESLNNTYTGSPVFVIGPNVFNFQGYFYFTAKVLPKVLAKVPEFVLQVVGDGCKALTPATGTKLTGFVQDLKAIYAESKFAICPLIGGTGQQTKIVEAMAHGVPVIALREVAKSSPIEHGINGLIAENAEQFAEYVVELYHNPQRCRQLGEAARATIAKNFSQEGLVEKLKPITDRVEEKESLKNLTMRNEATPLMQKQGPETNILESNHQVVKVLYDISVLGQGHYIPRARTGVFRVVENLARGLVSSQSCELYLGAVHYLNACMDYLAANPQFKSAHFNNSGLFSVLNTKLFDLYNTLDTHVKVSNLSAEKVEQKFLLNSLKESLDNALRILGSHPSPLDEDILAEVDVFHSPFHALPPQVKRFTKVKKFLTVYDLIPIYFPQFFDWKEDEKMAHTLASLEVDSYVVCISQSTKNDLCNHLGNKIDPEKVFVTPLAASSQVFFPCRDAMQIAAVRNKYRIPNAPYLLSLSTLEPRKNIDHVIRCFAKLIQEQNLNDLYLVLVGTAGWKYDKIMEEISKQSFLKERIIFTGYVPEVDLAALYSGALVFVYPSFYEGFGLPPLEAMQCGVPVITSNTSSLPEVVEEAGIMLDPKDTDGLCHSILELYNRPSLREAMSQKSLAQARKFSWERCTQETIAAYRTALS